MRLAFLASILLIAMPSFAGDEKPSPCDVLKQTIDRTYSFRPAELDAAARTKKIEEMDAVWRMVQSSPATLAPCLRTILGGTSNTWLLFNGALLLRSVDDSDPARRILLDALARVDLDDVDLQAWVQLASQLGLQGYDTSALGKRWLRYARAEYSLPRHGGYKVDRANGAQFIYGSMDERYATPALLELARASVGEQKENAVWLLMSQATPAALRALRTLDRRGLSEEAVANLDALLQKPQLIEPRRPPKTTRAEFVAAFEALLKGNDEPFNQLVEAVPDGERDLVAVVTEADHELLRKVRRHYIAVNSPHAIEYYNQFSLILMTLVWKPELVREDGR